MSNPFVSRVGGVVSADIAVPEHEKEIRFYSRVLSTGDKPLWREDLMNNHGAPIIGLGARNAETADLPLEWMVHIQVADVATSVQAALEHGGRELMHGKDADGNSQWAVMLDPNGTAFGLIPVVAQADMPATGDGSPVGCIAWLDLTVADASTLREFYRHVVGWTVEDVDMQDGDDSYADYNMLGNDGKPAAGVCHARGANAGLPSTWMIYLPVGDLAESLRRVSDEGGKVVKEAKNSDGKVAYAVVQDPVGVTFALVAG